MVNNFESIKPLLKFDSEDDFYFIQIIKRRKENEDLSSNAKVIKTFYLRDVEQLTKIKEEIIMSCKIHKARAYINLNRRSFKQAAFLTLKKVTDIIMSENYKSVINAYDSVCGGHSNESFKKWIIDIDEDNPLLVNSIIGFLKTLQPYDVKNKLIATIPTKNGLHLITSPFNIKEFNEVFKDIEVHKNNPTLLFIYD